MAWCTLANLAMANLPAAATFGKVLAFFSAILACQALQVRAGARFLDWILEHKSEILSGTALYRNQPITLGSQLVRFRAVFSGILWTNPVPTRFLLRDSHSIGLAATLASGVTLIFGWWSYLGPFAVVRTLRDNVRGGESITVGHFLQLAEEYDPLG